MPQVPIHIHAPKAQLAEVTAAAARIGASATAEWSSTITHCFASNGAAVTPAVVAAMLSKVPLVQQSWLEAVAQKRAWEGQLPAEDSHAPRQLQLHNGTLLELASWHMPPQDLLSSYHFVMDSRQWVGAWASCVHA